MKNEQIMGLLNPLIALIFAITFFVFWWKYKDKTYILGMSFAYLMHGTGFLISHLAADVNSPVHVFGTNILFSIGTISIVWAVCYRKQLDVPLGILALVAIFAMLALIYLQINAVEFNARLFITNTSYGIMFAIGAIFLFRNVGSGSIEKVLFVMFVLTALQFWTRPIITVSLDGNIDHLGYRDSIYYSVLNVTLALLSLMLAVSLIAACVSDIMTEMRTKTENDLLTGLKIRRVFESEAVPMFSKLMQSEVPMTMVVADIDHFKNVNDYYGHQVGDQAIGAFGRMMRKHITSDDLAGRIGGEEFCFLLWDTDLASAKVLSEKMRFQFSQANIDGMPEGHYLTASFGIAEFEQGDDYASLFKRADDALYNAKNSGRNRVSCGSSSSKIEYPFKVVS